MQECNESALDLRVNKFRSLYCYLGTFRSKALPSHIEIVESPRPTLQQIIALPTIVVVIGAFAGLAKNGMGASIPFIAVVIMCLSFAVVSLLALGAIAVFSTRRRPPLVQLGSQHFVFPRIDASIDRREALGCGFVEFRAENERDPSNQRRSWIGRTLEDMARVRDNYEDAPPLVGTLAFFLVYRNSNGDMRAMPFVAFPRAVRGRARRLMRLLQDSIGTLPIRSLTLFDDRGKKKAGYKDAAQALVAAFDGPSDLPSHRAVAQLPNGAT